MFIVSSLWPRWSACARTCLPAVRRCNVLDIGLVFRVMQRLERISRRWLRQVCHQPRTHQFGIRLFWQCLGKSLHLCACENGETLCWQIKLVKVKLNYKHCFQMAEARTFSKCGRVDTFFLQEIIQIWHNFCVY